jgi:hypothetical protein
MDRKRETVEAVKENHTENNCITTESRKPLERKKKIP